MAPSAEPYGPPSRRRPLLFLAIVAAAVPALLAAIWIWRIPLAEQAIRIWLERQGITPVAVPVEHIGPEGARLGQGRIAGLTFRSVDVAYDLDDLVRGRVGTVRIVGPSVAAIVDRDGITAPGLEPLTAPAGPADAGAPALPFDTLALEDATVALATPLGPVRLVGTGTITAVPGGSVRAEMDLAASGAPGDVESALRGRAVVDMAPDGRIDGTIALADATLAHATAGAEEIAGSLAFVVADRQLQSAVGSLTLRNAHIADLAIRSADAGIDYGPDGLTARLNADWSGGEASALVESDSADPDAPASVAARARIDAAWFADRFAPNVDLDGTVRLALVGSVYEPAALLGASLPEALAAITIMRTEAAAELQKVAIPGLGRAETIDGTVRATFVDGTLRLALPHPLRIAGAAPAPHLIESVPAEVARHLRQPVRLEIAAGSTSNMPAPAPPGAVAEVAIEATAEAGGLRLAATFAGDLDPADGFAPRRIGSATLSARIPTTSIAGVRLGGTLRLEDVKGEPGDLRGRAAADLQFAGAPSPTVRIDGGRASLSGSVRLDGTRLAFYPGPASSVLIEQGAVGSSELLAPLTLNPVPPTALVWQWDRAAVDARLVLGPAAAVIAVGQPGGAPAPLEFAVSEATIHWTGGGRLQSEVQGGRLGLPTYNLAADDVTADLDWQSGGRHRLRLVAGRVRHRADPAPIAPLVLELIADGTPDRTILQGSFYDPGRRLTGLIEGEHSLATGWGRAEIALAPVVFRPSGLQPGQIFPAGAGSVAEADGQIGGTAELRWGPPGLESSAVVEVDFRRLVAYGVEVSGLRSTVSLDSLAPLSTEFDQVVVIDRIDAGLPFTDARIAFELHPDGRVTGQLRELNLFGGRIRTEPFAFDPSTGRLSLVLGVEDVNLERFLEFAEYGELSATGILRGTIPIVLGPDGIGIRNAVLTTGPAGGEIRYRPRDAAAGLRDANPGSALLMQALEHFDYESIRIEIDERPVDGLTLSLSLRGSSPNVHDGYPMVVNINVSGALGEVLQQGIRSYQIPEEIQRRLQRREPPP